jgi:uncharacterized protein
MWLVIVTAILIVVAVLVRWFEASLAFFPIRGEDQTPARYGVPFTSLTVTTGDGERLRVWNIAAADARAQVVYFHGNGGNLAMWCDLLVDIARHGFEVIAFDYRGYGVSSGAPSEAGLYRDADAVVQFVHERARRPELPLIYWGRSLGTTVAAYASATKQPDGVILESPFTAMRAVLSNDPVLWTLSWFSSFRFPTAEWMADSRVPVLVLHGNRDTVIPYRLGQALYDQLRGPKHFVTIEGADHNDRPPDPETYWREIAKFAQRIARPTGDRGGTHR